MQTANPGFSSLAEKYAIFRRMGPLSRFVKNIQIMKPIVKFIGTIGKIPTFLE